MAFDPEDSQYVDHGSSFTIDIPAEANEFDGLNAYAATRSFLLPIPDHGGPLAVLRIPFDAVAVPQSGSRLPSDAARDDSAPAGVPFDASVSPSNSYDDSLSVTHLVLPTVGVVVPAGLPIRHPQLSPVSLELSPFDFELPSVNFKLPALDLELSSPGFKLSPVDLKLPPVGFELPSLGFKLSPVGLELPSFDLKLSSAGFELSPAGPKVFGAADWRIPPVICDHTVS